MPTHMKQTNPKLIYHLRQQPKALEVSTLTHLYDNPTRLDEDLSLLQRHGLVAVAGNAVQWKGS